VDDFVASGRHFSGTITRLLVEHVQERLGDTGVRSLLDGAGETRQREELVQDTNWSTYGQVRRLLEVAAPLLADVGGLDAIADTIDVVGSATPELAATLQSFGSPMAMTMAVVSGGFFTVIAFEPEALGPSRLRLHRRMLPDFEPFPELCAFLNGMAPLSARLFGMRTVEVSETSCQCGGDAECVTTMEWDENEDLSSQLELVRVQLQVAQARLNSFQEIVEEIVSTDDLDSVLTRIVHNAARATQAPGFILEVVESPSRRRVYTDGLTVEAAETVLAENSGSISVDVMSAHRRYGRLVAVSPTSVAFASGSLESYARLAANALDSAFSLEEARRQAQTTAALLQLSTKLAALASVGELSTTIANAMRDIIDCDYAAVLIVTDGTARVAAHDGFSPSAGAALLEIEVPVDVVDIDGVSIHTLDTAPAHTRSIMLSTGLEIIASIPIVLDDRPAGFLVAAVHSEAQRLTDDAMLCQRLAGLAGQAAVAMKNNLLVDEIRYQSLHDALTGLPNRALILDRAQHMLKRSKRDATPVGALFLDLDGFKEINDTLGHPAGDELLAMVGARLATAVRASDTVGRLGGDEFVVLAEGSSLDAGAEVVAERLLDVLREPFSLSGRDRPLTIGASIGIAVGERQTADELLKDADIALYCAKAAGKGCYRLFAQEMEVEVQARAELTEGMAGAIANQEFFLVYQPIVDLATERPTGVEALLRWQHPKRGVIPPDSFIPVLEETGMIIEVGRWVLAKACCQASEWHAAGHAIDMSVNVSVRQLERSDFIDDVRSALQESGLPPTSLIIEITETAIMRDASSIALVLKSLKRLGVRIAIDDFGTGYSSLAYLRQFPVDALKIDRSFISAAPESAAAAELIHTLVHLGKALHLETLAEGIEYRSQLIQLQEEGCDSGQGFMFARPLEADDVLEVLSRHDGSTSKEHHSPLASIDQT
jgi:diguanylate cyclase (GGDEF)-like protein